MWKPRSPLWGFPTAPRHFPRQLSGGQEQRVAIARAIVSDPTFLLCDEPTGDLDRKSADEIMALIEELVDKHNKTVLMVTHDPLVAARAHMVLHLEKGRPGGGVEVTPGTPWREVWHEIQPLILSNLFRKKVRSDPHPGFLCRGSVSLRLSRRGTGMPSTAAEASPAPTGWSPSTASPLFSPSLFPIATRFCAFPVFERVTHDNWFGGVYQDEKNFFPQFVIDPENQRQVFSELLVPDDQWKAFLKDRQGAIVGASTAKRFGWKIGDRIPIKTTIYGGGAPGSSILTASIMASVRRTTRRSSGFSGTISRSASPSGTRGRWAGIPSSSTRRMTPSVCQSH